MNELPDNEIAKQSEVSHISVESRDKLIGTGQRAGLWGFALIILAVLIVFIVLVYSGFYNPFEGAEKIGP